MNDPFGDNNRRRFSRQTKYLLILTWVFFFIGFADAISYGYIRGIVILGFVISGLLAWARTSIERE